MTEYILLGFLMQRDMTGYDMKQHMSMSTSYFVDASFGSIYPSLKKLVQKGLVELRETAENGKLKKTYSINPQGEAEFRRWLALPIETSKTDISAALAKIFFFDYLPPEEAVSLIEQYLRSIEEYQKGLLLLKARVEDKADEFELGTLHFGLDYYGFVTDWFQNYLKTLRQKDR